MTTVLKIDTTLMTTADGKRGKADWELDVPLPHAGKNVVKVWSVNAGGHSKNNFQFKIINWQFKIAKATTQAKKTDFAIENIVAI